MIRRRIGVMVDSFKAGTLKEGILEAKAVGADGLQIYAVDGEMHPDNIDSNGRGELKRFIADNGLSIAALCGDLGGHGFAIPEDNPARIETSMKIMDLAVEIGTDVVTTHIGVVPEDPGHERYRILQEACEALGEYGDRVGASFAIETGPEPANRLKRFLDSLASSGVRVNYDPANLVMVIGEDPSDGARILGDYIVHTHAKDGIMVQKHDPEVIYNYFADGGIEDLRLEDYFKEVSLGEGNVDFPTYLAALDEIGYSGFLTVERETGDDPGADIRMAVEFLKQLAEDGK